jgi:hypothetical protein
VKERLNRVWQWLKDTYGAEGFYEVLKTACGEIAVLLFVFPLIDMLGKDASPIHNWGLVLWSCTVGFSFIALAGVFAKKQADENLREDE